MPEKVITGLANDQLYGFRMFPRNMKNQYQTRIDIGTATAIPKSYDPILANNSWEVISEASSSGIASSVWNVGDEINITLTTNETLTLVILGFDHDDLADGSGKAGITFGMKNLMAATRPINSSNSMNGGFPASELHQWLQNDLYNSLPSDLKPFVKTVNKKCSTGTTQSTVGNYQMKIFLLTDSEIYNPSSNYLNEGDRYAYYENGGLTRKKLSNGNGDEIKWWSRNRRTNYTSGYSLNGSSVVNWQTEPENYWGICFNFCV